VPSDFSDSAAAAVRVAAALRNENTKVHVVHVLAPLPEVRDWTWDFEDERRESARAQLRLEGGEDMVCKVLLGSGGNPAVEIARYAEDIGADLIVTAARGRTGLARWLLGSVSEQLLRLSRCSILTVRYPLTARWRRVLLPFDFSEPAMRALRVARALAGESGDLYVLHVLPPLPPLGLSAARRAALQQDRIGQVHEDIAHVLNAHGVAATTHVVAGQALNPGARITSVASELDVGLIVIPSQGRSGLARLLLGSVATRVVRLADRPVLVLKEHAEEL
jgi:nucleotide-binding universal stress UspA family protein